ncbi:protein kinase [Nonomuraea sp. NN258]|nr:protein kinase [Nonomuraea antri]
MRPLLAGEPREIEGHHLLGRLGDGGQGSVFLGKDAAGRHVAIKVLHARLLTNDRATRRFLRESATAAQVAGFCTAKVYGSGLVDGRPYIVSEFIDGPSLHDLVFDGGPLTGGQLERLAVGTATALTAIHGAGIVHRDFKPSNVLMGPDGPRVIDFGIAKAMDASTTASSVVGTPGYMAPEQIAGESVTSAGDIFSWASTMAFAATGTPLFGRDSIPAVMNRILNAEPDLSEVPRPLRGVLEACLAKDPAKRPTADDVLMRLLGRTGEQAAGATRVLEPESARRRGRTGGLLAGKRRKWTAAGVGVLLAAGLVVGLVWRGGGMPAASGSVATNRTIGVELGGSAGPVARGVAAMAVGNRKGVAMVAYADDVARVVRVWRPEANGEVRTLKYGTYTPVSSMALADVAGEQTVFWTDTGGKLRRWRVDQPAQGPWRQVCPSGGARMTAGKWRTRAALFIGCPDGTVRIADMATGELIGQEPRAKGPVTALDLGGGQDTELVVGTAKGWSGTRGTLVPGSVRWLASIDQNLVAATVAGRTSVHNAATGRQLRTFSTGKGGMAVVQGHGHPMIVGGDGLTVWNARTGEKLGRLLESDAWAPILATGDGLLAASVGNRLRAWSLVDEG